MLRKVNVVQNYGNRKAMLDMIASEVTALPSINDVVEGYEVQAGSWAYIAKSDIWATLLDDNKMTINGTAAVRRYRPNLPMTIPSLRKA